MSKRFWEAVFVGFVAAFAFLGMSVYCEELELEFLAKALNWPNTLLQSLTPVVNLGTAEHPVLEGTPLNDVAFFVSVPLGAIVYGILYFYVQRFATRVP